MYVDPSQKAHLVHIANTAPRFIPNVLARKVYSTFQQTYLTPSLGVSDSIQRPLLLQNGLTSKLVNIVVKIILGQTLYTELKSELSKPVIATLAEKMKSREGVTLENLKNVTHREVAAAHLQVAPDKEKNYAFLATKEGWHSLDIRSKDGVCTVIENKVCPTSERALNMEQHLNNIYVKIDDTGRITITCGVINSKEKADEFVEAVKWAVEKRGEPSPPLRISMHQLNSMGVGPGVFVAEKDLVEQQHHLISYINSKLSQKEPVVSHTNRCLNGFTQIKGEDAKSHAVNQEGLSIQMRWLCEDLKIPLLHTTDILQRTHALLIEKENEHPEIQKKLDVCNQKIATLILDDLTSLGITDHTKFQEYDQLLQEKADLEKKNAEIKSIKQHIHKLKIQLHGENKELCKSLHKASFKETGDRRTKLELATAILASQTGLTTELGLKPLSATQELACMFLLDHALNAVTEINCKSGLDRTGFARSLQTVLQRQVKNVGLSETFDFITKFEENVQLMDHGGSDSEVEQFQKDLLRELTEVAIPITERSSGLKGLKWHWGIKTVNPFQANPHPVNWLPRAGGANFELVNGKRKVTDRFAFALCGLSPKRGG